MIVPASRPRADGTMAACDACADLALLLNGSGASPGRQLTWREFQAVEKQVTAWPSRYCSCCFNDPANFEKLNDLLQRILAQAIKWLETLTKCVGKTHRKEKQARETEEKPKGRESRAHEEAGDGRNDDDDDDDDEEEKRWSLDDRQRLLQMAARIFQPGFPLYLAYKRVSHCSTLEDLSQQEAAALGSYCQLNDPDLPVFLMRNVCFWLDSGGPAAIARCFQEALDQEEKATKERTMGQNQVILRR